MPPPSLTHRRTRMHTSVGTRTGTRTHTHMHAHIRTHMHIRTHAGTRTHLWTKVGGVWLELHLVSVDVLALTARGQLDNLVNLILELFVQWLHLLHRNSQHDKAILFRQHLGAATTSERSRGGAGAEQSTAGKEKSKQRHKHTCKNNSEGGRSGWLPVVKTYQRHRDPQWVFLAA